MNVASLELCKELVERSYWLGTDYFYQYREYEDGSHGYHLINPELEEPLSAHNYPAYDLGFMMRRLPQHISVDGAASRLEFHPFAKDSTKWVTGYMKPDIWSSEWHILAVADTPEDAACSLAIEMLKYGMLTKEGK